MSRPGLSFGLNLSKKSAAARSRPLKHTAAFGGGGDSDDEAQDRRKTGAEETTTVLHDLSTSPTAPNTDQKHSSHKQKHGSSTEAPPPPPRLKSKRDPMAQFGDLSSALSSRRYAEEAEQLDPSVYDYDAAYDSFATQRKRVEAQKKDAGERKARYMADVTKAAELRERDRSIAELKKIQRDREAEGEEFADKEKFVTEAYKRKQEEDRRAEEEEKRMEEEEARKNKLGGMTGFHKELLEREDRRYAEVQRTAEEAKKSGGLKKEEVEEEDPEKTETDIAREINARGGSIAINEDGQVVDKRQLLKGGLNLAARKKAEAPKEPGRATANAGSHDQGRGHFGSGGKRAMRERQSRMLEAQLEQTLKRTRDEEEEERKKVELEAKSHKTSGEISSAKERYLARKRAAEEEKKKALAEQA